MELGKVRKINAPLDLINVKEIPKVDPLYDTEWAPEKSPPGWCSDNVRKVILGVDVKSPTLFQYAPKILPKMKFVDISFLTEYLNPSAVPCKFTLGFLNRQGKIVEKTLEASGHRAGRVGFSLSVLDFDPSRLFKAYLEVTPEDEDSPVFVSGSWLEINAEA